MRIIVLLCLLLLLLPITSHAQKPEPLNAPIIATNIPDQSGILLIDVTTGEKRLLSFGLGNHYVGDFSPDGCELLFTWEARLGRGELYAARLDGSNLRKLTEIPSTGALSYLAWEPQWSPDGSRIVYAFVRYYDPPDQEAYRTSHIAWVPAEGGEPHFYSNSGTEWQPRWSPDGTRLVYASVQAVEGDTLTETGEPVIKPELWMVNADGSNKFRLTSYAEGGAFNPRWSPDGTQIAYIYEPTPNNHQLLMTSQDGFNGFAVVSDQAMILDFTWQPSGRDLVVAVRGLDGVGENVLWNITPVADGVRSILIYEPATDYPRFSPDGTWLAFRSAYELVIRNTTQPGELIYLGEDTLNNSAAVWSPPGFQGEAACTN